MHQHLKQDGLQIEVFNAISFKKNDAQHNKTLQPTAKNAAAELCRYVCECYT